MSFKCTVCLPFPYLVPFFFNPKGGVGTPSRWSSGNQEDSWRGGFLLAALQMYLKNDMRAKFVFLHDVEAAVGFTSTMMTQDFEGSTTIVPNVRFRDFFTLFTDPKLEDLYHYFQEGSVAAYGHMSMISLHNKIANTVDDCIARLEGGKRLSEMRRLSALSLSSRTSSDNGRDRTGSWHAGVQSKKPTDSVDLVVADLLREKALNNESLGVQGPDLDEDDYENF